MRLILISLVFFIVSVDLWADEISEELLAIGYIEKDVPSVGSDMWSAANANFPAMFVGKGNPLIIRKATREETDPSEVLFDTGSIKYIGIDHGEFGGGLYINKFDESTEPLFKGNVRALIPIDKDLYIVSGLAHMSFSRGAIHVIRNYINPSKPEQVTLLPDAPEAIAIGESWRGKKKFIIAGHSSLMTFSPDSDFEIVKFDAFWASLYPSSIIEYKKSYIIGIRSGLAVVTPSYGNAKVRYFVPN